MLHFFECNILDILLKQNYEKPVDTAEDVRDRGFTVVSYPGAASKLEVMKNSPSEITRILAERTIVPKVIFIL